MNLKRISITGPESTGKSWLAEKLAGQFATCWVPEYSRDYLRSLGRPYSFEDIVNIAQGQLDRENKMAEMAHGLIFCDTDPLVTKIWSDFKYGSCDPWILDQVMNHRYELYLLCDIDLPWESDPLREHPDKRKELFMLYRATLETMKVNWAVVSGSGNQRLDKAIELVNESLEYCNSC